MSQIVVHIDDELKKIAMNMAKKEGLTMKALLSFLLKGYVENDIKLGARLNRDYNFELEYENWSSKELDILNNDNELSGLTLEFNNLLAKKGM